MRVWFADYTVDSATRQLLRGSEEVPLPAKTFALLELLLTERPRAVSKQEIHDRLWPGTFVTESNLTSLISDLRSALGDDAQRPRFLRTVHGHGYAFCGVVEDAGTPPGGASPEGLVSRSAGRTPSRWASVAIVLVGLALVAVTAWRVRQTSARSPFVASHAARLTIPLPEGTVAGPRANVAISRDGTMVAAVARRPGSDSGLYVRALDQWDWKRLQSADEIRGPFFSPDGEWLGYFANGRILRVPVAGGSPQIVCDAIASGSARWGEDGQILFTTRWKPGVWRVAATGGTPEVFVGGEGGGIEAVTYDSPYLLPSGRTLLVSVWAEGHAHVDAIRLDGRERRTLVAGGHGLYTSTGHLVYSVDNQLLAIPFDEHALATKGVGVPLVADLRHLEIGIEPSGAFAISDTGTLVYTPDARLEKRFIWMDRSGKTTPLPFASRHFSRYALSPDTSRVAVTIVEGTKRDVWVGDMSRGTLSRLTSDGDSLFSLWSPDGRDIVYTSRRDGAYNLYRVRVDSGLEPQQLTEGTNAKRATSWSPHGDSVLLYDLDPVTRSDIWVLPLATGAKARPLIKTPANEVHGTFSPDGRWLAYVSNESGTSEVYIRAYPSLAQKTIVSNDGGSLPFWGPTAGELFYVHGDQLLSVTVMPEERLLVGTPRVLVRGANIELTASELGSGTLTQDGSRFLFLDDTGDTTTRSRLHVVRDWFDELNRRVPVSGSQ